MLNGIKYRLFPTTRDVVLCNCTHAGVPVAGLVKNIGFLKKKFLDF